MDDTSATRRSPTAREAALDFMRSRDARVSMSRSDAAALPAAKPAPGFEELPQYKQLAVQEAVRQQLGLENPFYRAHDFVSKTRTTIDGRALSNFSSYDYLGFNDHPSVQAQAREAITRYGLSTSASRVVAGERPVHAELEAEIASLYGVEEAVAFVSGYLTNLTTIPALVSAQDLILHDELIHNSALTGAQHSGATRRSFRHNDVADLDRQLAALAGRHRRVLVIVEGLYSMDGDIADLPGLLVLKERYGFWLMVDEAHALGVLGKTGRGSHEHFDIDPGLVDVWMGTLSKTAASCGGYVAGSRALVTLLKGHAGGFVFSVGLSPVLAAGALEALKLIGREPERVARLQSNGRYFLDAASKAGLDTGASAGFSVVPTMVGDSVRAAVLSVELIEDGINVLPIIFPAVPEGQARLRFFITSEHDRSQMDEAATHTARKLKALEERGVGVSSVDNEAILQALP